MSASATPELFDQKVSTSYDERNRKVGAINENLHLLIRLILADLPADAHILCVGVGTGMEIVRLAEIFPQWRFTGVDPSAAMLDVCRNRLQENQLESRCTLFHGYLHDLKEDTRYDTVLCLLVTHFIKDAPARQAMFADMANRLTSGGYLINAEISGDESTSEFAELTQAWKSLHRHTGASAEQLDNMMAKTRQHVAIAPPSVIESYLRDSGLPTPVLFFQSLLIHAWYSRKP
jgi:tRNA (cmo5U34)-methyltransferase